MYTVEVYKHTSFTSSSGYRWQLIIPRLMSSSVENADFFIKSESSSVNEATLLPTTLLTKKESIDSQSAAKYLLDFIFYYVFLMKSIFLSQNMFYILIHSHTEMNVFVAMEYERRNI